MVFMWVGGGGGTRVMYVCMCACMCGGGVGSGPGLSSLRQGQRQNGPHGANSMCSA